MDDVMAGDLGSVAALMGDRARAAMLTTLMGGQALTASELAQAASITKPTASAHLARLLAAGLVTVEVQGRHRYYALSCREVASSVEALMVLAGRLGAARQRGPADPALRRARVCYDHLAGEIGVQLYDRLCERGWVVNQGRDLSLSEGGERFCAGLGIDVPTLRARRRPLCLSCLDWSLRRHHLAGAIGAAILERCLRLGWARQRRGSRALIFSAVGERALFRGFESHRRQPSPVNRLHI
jgi:DNA-binding transcriptional ArsR family regulator